MLLLVFKYIACKLLTDTASRERVAAASRCTLNRLAGAWDAPPLNRIAVTIKVLLLYIFAMRLLVFKYIACKLLTDKTVKTISNKYSCQVVLDTTVLDYY